MASKDYVAELSRKPLGFKIALLAGVVVVLGFLYWQFFYSELSDELQQERTRTNTLTKKGEKLQRDLKEWNELVLKKQSLDEELRRNQVSLPASSELPSFFLHLQKQAAGAGVKLDNWRRLKESTIESYIKVPVAMEVTGTFYQINNYFKLLYETERIITVENMALVHNKTTNDEVQLTATFTASTFRLPDQPPDTNLPATPEAPKGGKGKVKDANKQRGNQLDKASGGKQPAGGPVKPAPGASKTPAPGAGKTPAPGKAQPAPGAAKQPTPAGGKQ